MLRRHANGAGARHQRLTRLRLGAARPAGHASAVRASTFRDRSLSWRSRLLAPPVCSVPCTDALVLLLGSGYSETERLADIARRTCGHDTSGWTLLQQPFTTVGSWPGRARAEIKLAAENRSCRRANEEESERLTSGRLWPGPAGNDWLLCGREAQGAGLEPWAASELLDGPVWVGLLSSPQGGSSHRWGDGQSCVVDRLL